MTRQEWCEFVVYMIGGAVLIALLWRVPDLLAALGAIPWKPCS